LAQLEFAHGRLDEAEKKYLELKELSDHGASWAYAGLADLAFYQGRLKDAVELLEEGITFDQEKNYRYYEANKHLILGQVQINQGKNTNVVESAEKALALNKRSEIKFAAACLFMNAGQDGRARDLAAEMVGEIQDIDHAYAKIISGSLAQKRGDVTNAIKLFDDACALVDMWLGRYALGRAYLEAGTYAEAFAEFEKCEKRRSEAMSVFLMDLPTCRYLDSLDYYMGRALEGMGSPAANEYYQKFLDNKANADPGNPLVSDTQSRLLSY
jgi:tetratricopeptide (TPR) repeat protein